MQNSYSFNKADLNSKSNQENIKDKITYLHVSSCFQRKAPDVLIYAYCKAFFDRSDTSLVIKTGWNPHVDIHGLLQTARNEFGYIADTISLIEKDLSDYDLSTLFAQSDFNVYPSRGEGFGIPVIEAHRAQKPCIIPKSTALAELFIDSVDYKIESNPDYSRSHLALPGSLWWEPDTQSLVQQFIKSRLDYIAKDKYQEAVGLLADFTWPTWDESAIDIYEKLRSIKNKKNIEIYNKKNEIKIISTINTKCGIAEFTKLISDHFPDTFEKKYIAPVATSTTLGNEEDVIRVWEHWGKDVGKKISNVINENDFVLIQHHTGFFSTHELELIIENCLKKGCIVIVELHSALDDKHSPGCYKHLYRKFIKNRDITFIVHSKREFESLNLDFDISSNLKLVALPFFDVDIHCEYRSINSSRLIAAFGFMRSHKGFDKLIHAFKIHSYKNPTDKLILLTSVTDDPDSKKTYSNLLTLISDLGLSSNVNIITEYLSLSEIMAVLGYCDCTVFPYQDVTEGASGAVRVAISSGAAVICSKEATMFDELTDNILRFSDEKDLAQIIGEVVLNRDYREYRRLLSKNLASKWSFKDHSNYLSNIFLSKDENRYDL